MESKHPLKSKFSPINRRYKRDGVISRRRSGLGCLLFKDDVVDCCCCCCDAGGKRIRPNDTFANASDMAFILASAIFFFRAPGDIQAIINVFVLPPRLSCNNLVNFESLNGICFDFPSTNADITLPNADNDKLILVASFKRSPAAPVFDCRSLPARSTKFNLPNFTSLDSKSIVCIQSAFINVAPTERFFQPFSIIISHERTSFTICIERLPT
ncbi:hypothetical protein DERP_000950 [Dermatophagoides pteronyssinus]|uniref:Uncharacterized protein n=1 Tax=Dermatophagoides pteronyssinus TaxID=6956 RepID=A0ABQ8JD49_DERPT|nr:hypothetical protein DERP_000950 [Dermatophagoides pteronyssinus]